MRRRWVRFLALVTVAAVVTALVATTATASPPQGVSMRGTGPQPPGLGLFSKAALAQEQCAANGHTRGSYDGGGPFCVNPWPEGKSNGGATAPGVTATQVKVVFYVPNDQMIAASTSPKPTSQATGAGVPPADAVRDYATAYQYMQEHNGTWQLWGRKPVIETVTASGTDEAAQRADAVTVIAKKPFIVVDATATSGGADVFTTAVAQKKIVVASPSTTADNGTAQAPYRWNSTSDPSAAPIVTAAFLGKSLANKKARWAGDALKDKTRTFGAVYPSDGTFDIDAVKSQLAKNGAKFTETLGFDPANAQAGSPEVATIIGRLKSSGVTSVVLFAPRTVVQQLMTVATSQDYFPEWLYTGYDYQEYVGVVRMNDAKQMVHAFGLAQIGPYLTDMSTSLGPASSWYWGTTQGDSWPGASGGMEFLYAAMHYAGPTLTAKNIEKGLFAAPAELRAAVPQIGKWGYGKTVGMPYEVRASNGTDRALIWWDPDTVGLAVGTTTAAQGVWEFLNDGVNVGYSDFTKAEPKFFDKSASVLTRSALDYYPDHTAPTPVPCPECPSQGGPGVSS
jgi:hypothetical protein